MKTTTDRLVRISANGLGDGQNAYAHSMAWYAGCLYVGTTRNNLCLIKSNPKRDTLSIWPVRCPADIYTLDMRAQIWRYNPRHDQWTRIYTSPLVIGTKGRRVPRDIGYRNMVVFRGKSDSAPALYVTTMSWTEAPAACFLRSADGVTFHPVSAPGLKDLIASSFRSVAEFNGHLYTSPAGEGTAFYAARLPVVIETDDPVRGVWRPVSIPGFGDAGNTLITELAVFNGFLYAGTVNPERGLQIWKTRAHGNPPYRWTKVLSLGAYRGKLNEGVLSFGVFRGALYVGTHIAMGGHDRKYEVGPAAAELIRLWPDDEWDLIAGTPRWTPAGYKYPLSKMGPGFNDPFNTYIWCLHEYHGWLYAGTFNSSVFLPYVEASRIPAGVQDKIRRAGMDAVMREAGCDLWRSQDGEQWDPVTHNGFDNAFNYGVRNLVSSPSGLYIGTTNPFGPQVASNIGTGEWKYADNPRGGLEIWLLKPNAADTSALAPRSTSKTVSPHWTWRSPSAKSCYGALLWEDIPAYGQHDVFTNCGYWRKETKTQKEACETLTEQLLAMVPNKEGTILEIACGSGAATTRYLAKHYLPKCITAIDISERQIARCRKNVPGSTALQMQATNLRFPAESFHTLICVEAAFHFVTRKDFLAEAYRVLRSGGYLVLSDILFPRNAETLWPCLCAENWLADPDAYREVLLETGFRDVHVVDATAECFNGLNRAYAQDALHMVRSGEMDWHTFQTLWLRAQSKKTLATYYVLASAKKPQQ